MSEMQILSHLVYALPFSILIQKSLILLWQLTVLTVYVFLYGRLYLVLSGLEKGLSTQRATRDNKGLQVALASQSFVQIGFHTNALTVGSCVFFTFSLATKIHYYGNTFSKNLTWISSKP